VCHRDPCGRRAARSAAALRYHACGLQRVSVCCNVLQCVAVGHRCLQCVTLGCSVTVGYIVLLWCRRAARSAAALSYHTCVLQCVAVCGSVLQCFAVYCSVLQWITLCCFGVDELREVQRRSGTTHVCCNVLQCVAVCCSVLLCVAVRWTSCEKCSGAQVPHVCCSVL